MTDKNITASAKYILALDTCTESCSAALIDKQGKIYAEQADAPREHSQRLLPMVESVLKQAEIKLADVDLIAYGRGPGSFTGIRICTSITQGLALGQALPVIGVSTLATMAQAAITELNASHVLAAIDARMGEVYWGHYQAIDGIATLVGEEVVSAPKDIILEFNGEQSVHICGTGFEAYPELKQMRDHFIAADLAMFPNARYMLPLAAAGDKQGLSTSVDELTPVYLRDTVTWKKLPGRE